MMRSKRTRAQGDASPRRLRRGRPEGDDVDGWSADGGQDSRSRGPQAFAGSGEDQQRHRGGPGPAQPPGRSRNTDGREDSDPDVISPAGTPVAWRTASGWKVGDEEVSDLTSAMVLADLLAADLPPSPPPGTAGHQDAGPADARKLQETVAQLEHALTVRVRVEQAIGVLAERHRLRPRQAFELLRSAARVRGRRVLEVAGEVVESATNPLLRIPEELSRPPAPRRRGRIPRHSLSSE